MLRIHSERLIRIVRSVWKDHKCGRGDKGRLESSCHDCESMIKERYKRWFVTNGKLDTVCLVSTDNPFFNEAGYGIERCFVCLQDIDDIKRCKHRASHVPDNGYRGDIVEFEMVSDPKEEDIQNIPV